MLSTEILNPQLIFQSAKTSVYRGSHRDHEAVVVKVLNTPLPTPDQVRQFHNEQDILRNVDLPGVRKVLDRGEWEGRPALVLEYVPGERLKDLMEVGLFSFRDKLACAVTLARVLAGIHQCRIIHKDVSPRNILVGPEPGQAWLIDFEFATQLDLKNHRLGNPEHIQGTLPYISPEQTGRMNRVLDYRSDLYSLGVCYYELFAGRLPFENEDPMELVYSHLARTPEPPRRVDPQMPKVLSELILKLLEKNAEDRYQSAAGVQADLQKCLDHWEDDRSVPAFPLAAHDFSGRFQIPQKLYGRQTEIDTLLRAYRSISQGEFLLLLVAGYSGVGKSSLVYEVHKPLTENRGFFIEGKFDQYQRELPYSAWLQAFDQFVDLLLTENPVQLEAWKEQLLTALRGEGGVLTGVLPSLERILGTQPPVPEIGERENKLRFQRVFKRFVHGIAKAEHPLFIFLDDWQWADPASIELLESLAFEPDNRYFILSGAYRDNEVLPTHPFATLLDRCRRRHVPMEEIALGNLCPEDVSLLLTETLRRSREACQDLTDLCFEKTRGNAFFLRQMLHTLHARQALRFAVSPTDRRWTWDIGQVRSLRIADNVVDLMVERVRKLPEATVEMLKTAACIGTLFGRDMLAVVREDDPEQVQQDLHPALLDGYVIPSGPHFTFAHDRIQQAVYSLIPEAERHAAHYRIGSLLWKSARGPGQEEKHIDEQLFDIVNQLVEGQKHIQNAEERQDVAALLLRAGNKAKAASAYETALRFYEVGKGLLEDDHWDSRYELMMGLHYQRADVAMTLQRFEEAAPAFEQLLDHAATLFDQARILSRIGLYHFWASHSTDASKYMIEGLRTCGIPIPATNRAMKAAIDRERQRVDALLVRIAPESFLNSPAVGDEMRQLTMILFANLVMAEKVLGRELKFRYFLLLGMRLTLEHGAHRATANLFSLFCSLLAQEHRYREAFHMSQLAVQLVQSDISQFRPVHTLTRAALWGYPYGAHLREAIPIYESGFSLTRRDEYFMFANIKIDILFHQTARGMPADDLIPLIDEAIHIGLDSGFLIFHDLGRIEMDLICHLRGEPKEPSLLTDAAALDSLHHYELSFIKGFLCHNEIQFYCWFPDHPAPSDFLVRAKTQHQALISNIKWADYDFYAALFITLRHPEAVRIKSEPFWSEINEYARHLQLRSEACPDNFLHKYHLVQAELARLGGQAWQATHHFRRATEAAEQYGFTHIHALAHELFARFYLEEGDRSAAAGHLREARRLYHKWGALAKVRQLEEQFPNPFQSFAPTTRSSGSSSSQALDHISLLKASQALSGEIILSNLLERMLPIVLECAGAEEVTVLESADGVLCPIARTSGQSGAELYPKKTAADATQLPLSLLHYVMRTREPVVLEDAARSERFSRDPYMSARKPRSVLCFPILRNEHLSALFYFENNLAAGVFNQQRLATLHALSGQISISLDNARLYSQVEVALARQVQLTDAYSKFVPREFIRHLGRESILDVRLGDQVQGEMSILFADIRGYSTLSEAMTPRENFAFINAYLRRVGPLISAHGGFVGQYYGDGFMAIFMQKPQAAVRAAVAIQDSMLTYNERRRAKGRQPIRVGVGIHTGPLMMGIIGDERRLDTGIISDTVNTASRLEGLTKYFQAKVIISEHSQSHMADAPGLMTRFLGKVSVKGKQEILPIYEVFNPEADDIDRQKAKSKAGFEAGLAAYFERDFVNATLQLKQIVQAYPEDAVAQQYLRRAAGYLVDGVSDDWTGVVSLQVK